MLSPGVFVVFFREKTRTIINIVSHFNKCKVPPIINYNEDVTYLISPLGGGEGMKHYLNITWKSFNSIITAESLRE